MNRNQFLLIALFALCGVAAAADDYASKSNSSAPRYTFSWPLDNEALKPRGGTTKGAPITLDRAPSLEWQALQAKGLTDVERDRRAILAMAGTYRVTFDFLEITPFDAQAKLNAPYQSWGTEKVYVASNSPTSISLAHILEMRVVQNDGKLSEPMVVKHWRQDWKYQPSHIVEYQGRDRWQRRKLSTAEAKNAWVQTVYQVDESPRYASAGRWQHSASFSTWVSNEASRPLPRREWSVRDDYQVLLGTNRHTVTATGWIQEENNLKTVLTPTRELAAQPYLAREYGVARYERIRDADFAAADHYYKATEAFWNRVRDVWSEAFSMHSTVTLRGPVDKMGLFVPLFAHADELAEKGVAQNNADTVIREALLAMGVPQ